MYRNRKIKRSFLTTTKKYFQMQNDDKEVDYIFNKPVIKIYRKIIIFQHFKSGNEYL